MAKLKVKKLTRAEQYNMDFAGAASRLSKTRKGAFTVDDVIAKVGTPPQGGKALGALMNAAVGRLNLSPVGYSRSKQPSRRGALNTAWKA